MDQIVSIKVDASGPFTGIYYVGSLITASVDSFKIANPIRFCETFIQKEIVVGRDAAGKDIRQNTLVPQTQNVDEGGLSFKEISVARSKAIVICDVTEVSNPGLFKAYHDSLRIRNANMAGLVLPEQGPQEVNQ